MTKYMIYVCDGDPAVRQRDIDECNKLAREKGYNVSEIFSDEDRKQSLS